MVQSLVTGLPDLAPGTPWLPIIPISFVLFTGVIREGIEDFNRYLHDKRSNQSLTKVLNGAEFKQEKWENVHVGQIIKVENGETFPADLILLQVSSNNGICYMQTSNLDGETALKTRMALAATQHAQLGSIEGKVQVDKPNNKLYEMNGKIELSKTEEYFSIKNSVLRVFP